MKFSDLAGYAEDDTAIQIQPSENVDYLSQNWQEADLWSLWKHIAPQRGAYNNSVRSENASWRAWTKSHKRLKTISPGSLEW